MLQSGPSGSNIRALPLRKSCPPSVSESIDAAKAAQYYIIAEHGPLSLMLREHIPQLEHQTVENDSGAIATTSSSARSTAKKFKVSLGAKQSCTCPHHLNTSELCTHILWTMMRVFRVPENADMLYQLALTDWEIETLLDYRRTFAPPRAAVTKAKSGSPHAKEVQVIPARPIQNDDSCPICLNNLLDHENSPESEDKSTSSGLIHCSLSCGNSIHIKCLQILMEHQQRQDPMAEHIKCPLCRNHFGRVIDLKDAINTHSERNRRASTQRSKQPVDETHFGFSCKQCLVTPIIGIKHSCQTCRDVCLCQDCFLRGAHAHHLFTHRPRKHGRAKPSLRHVHQPLPERVIIDLQQRDLSEEDYELLLNLDAKVAQGGGSSSSCVPTPRLLPLHVINTFPVSQVGHGRAALVEAEALLGINGRCKICFGPPVTMGILRQIPCGHSFHQPCIDRYLLQHESNCPQCGLTAILEVAEMEEGSASAAQYESTTSAIPKPRRKREQKPLAKAIAEAKQNQVAMMEEAILSIQGSSASTLPPLAYRSGSCHRGGFTLSESLKADKINLRQTRVISRRVPSHLKTPPPILTALEVVACKSISALEADAMICEDSPSTPPMTTPLLPMITGLHRSFQSAALSRRGKLPAVSVMSCRSTMGFPPLNPLKSATTLPQKAIFGGLTTNAPDALCFLAAGVKTTLNNQQRVVRLRTPCSK